MRGIESINVLMSPIMSRGQGFGTADSIQKNRSGGATLASKVSDQIIKNASAEDKAAFAIAARKAAATERIELSSVGTGDGALRITDSIPNPSDSNAEPDEVPPQEAKAPATQEEKPQSSAAPDAPAPVQKAEDSSALILRALELFNSQTVTPLKQDLAAAESARVASEAARVAAEAQLQAMQAQLSSANETIGTFSDLHKLLGKGKESPQGGGEVMGSPNIMSQSNSQGDRLIGAAAEFEQVISSSAVNIWNEETGGYEVRHDDRKASEFLKSHRDAFRRDLETSMKNAGLLRGNSRSAGPENSAPTSMVDVVGGFLPMLSAEMRENNRASFIWHQFPTTRIAFGEGQGGNVQVPRAAFQPAPTTPNSRLLSGGGVYQSIAPENQAIQTGVVSVAIQEWGLGGSASAAPIGIPTFVNQYSLINLMDLMRRNLWQDYITWEDMKARSLYAPTSRVVYNKKNRVTTDQTTLAANDGGVATIQYAEALSDYAKTLLIPTLPDGCYVWVVPTKFLTSLRESLDSELLAPSPGDLTIVQAYLNNTTGGMVDKVTGYKGKLGNVHLFEGNSWGIGAPGTEGVQSETIAGGAKTTRSGYFFGADTTGRGIGQEFNIRLQGGETHFNRLVRAIWIEYSGWVALDVDPVGYADASAVPQQLRVLETRMLDVAI